MQTRKLFPDYKLPKQLSDSELNSLLNEMHLGNLEPKEKIISHNIGLVISEIKREFANTFYDMEDLISIGIIGLINSIDTFNLNKNIKFSTYSTSCIKNEILQYINNNNKYNNNISFEQTLLKKSDDHEEDIKLEDALVDRDCNIELDYEIKDLNFHIGKTLESLSELEKKVTMKYFGFNDNIPLSQQKIADELGICKQYVSQILNKVLKKLSTEISKIMDYNSNEPIKINKLKKQIVK